MKEHQMYPYNPNSAESVLTEKLKGASYAWVDNQRAIVIEAMEDYANQVRNRTIDECIERLSSYRDIDRTQMKEELKSLKTAHGEHLNRMKTEDKERIEKDAEDFASTFKPEVKAIVKASYNSAAIAEHNLLKPQLEYADNYIQMMTEDRDRQLKQERSKAIELIDAAEGLVQWCKSVYQTPDEYYQVKKVLESLKH